MMSMVIKGANGFVLISVCTSVALISLVVYIIYMEVFVGYQDGYKYYQSHYPRRQLLKGGEVVVPPIIIDIGKTEGYIVGLNMPMSALDCPEDGALIHVIEKDIRQYFILNTKTDELKFYDNQFDFETEMMKKKLNYEIRMDFDYFDKVWKRNGKYKYPEIDFSTCHQLSTLP